MKIHALPLMIAVALTSACAQAASPPVAAPTPKAAAPAADPAAARAEIDRLIARIQELSRQLGDDTRVQVERRRFDGMGPPPPPGAPGDGREVIIERHRMDGSPMHGDMMHGELLPGAMMAPNSAGIGVVLAPNQAASGVRIAAVTPDSPAMKAGLRTGDILLSVDGKKVSGSGGEGVESARHLLGGLKKDQIVKLGYAREGKTGQATVKADNIRRMMMFNRGEPGDMPGMPGDGRGEQHFKVFAPEIDAEIAQGFPMKHCAPGSQDCAMPAMFEAFRWQGLNLASIDPQLGHYFGADRGVLVLSNGAELKGLQTGDVIQRVAGSDVNTPRDVMRSLREKSAGSQLKLDVLRDRKVMALTVTVPEARALPFMAPPPPPAPPAPPAPPTPRVPGVAPPAPPPPPHAPGVAAPPAPPAPPVPPNTSGFAPPAPPAPPTPAALPPPPPPPPQAPMAMMDVPDDGMFTGDVEEQRYVDDNGEEQVDVTITPSN